MPADRVPQPGDRWRGVWQPSASLGVRVVGVTDDGDVLFTYNRSGTENALTLADFVRAYVFVEADVAVAS